MPKQTIHLTVGAASSLAPLLPRLIATFRNQGKETQDIEIRPTFGASGTLVQQIKAGAPIDIFLSAGEKEVNDLLKAGAVSGQSRTVFAENRLVLAQTKNARTRIRDWADLAHLPRGFRIALGKPETVPAGRYARQTLEHRHLYAPLQSDRALVFTGTVRQAADAVATGNVDAALIFATDVRADSRLRTLQTAEPGKDHAPIRYVAVVVKRSPYPREAALFQAFLRSPAVKSQLKESGFSV